MANSFMCSFDVSSLFTNIPLRPTPKICLATLYRDESVSVPPIPEALVEKLLIKATTEVEFSFNGVMYRQIDGVAMGRLLALSSPTSLWVTVNLRLTRRTGPSFTIG